MNRIAAVSLILHKNDYRDTAQPCPVSGQARSISSGTLRIAIGGAVRRAVRRRGRKGLSRYPSEDLFVLLMPLMLGGRVVLQDIWHPAVAASLIAGERITYCMGTTPFLNDFANHDNILQVDISSLRYFIPGGAPIPSMLTRRLSARSSSGDSWIGGALGASTVPSVEAGRACARAN